MKRTEGKDPDFIPPEQRPVVDIAATDYQPSRKSFITDLRVPEAFDETVNALLKPVQVRQVDPKKS